MPITLYSCPTPSEPPLPDRLISFFCVTPGCNLLTAAWSSPLATTKQ